MHEESVLAKVILKNAAPLGWDTIVLASEMAAGMVKLGGMPNFQRRLTSQMQMTVEEGVQMQRVESLM